ncbi:MAG: hypothetical protein KGK03_03145 [Candidatus Omnitrophica bacterium]|nr:hypothetical protein [Candidatus Omnitrophota bacterium]
MWSLVFKGIIGILAALLIAVDVQLTIVCRQQKAAIDAIKEKQDVEAEFNSRKFNYQQDQIEHLSRSLQDISRQINAQQDENKSIETDMVDIKAEADAVKQQAQGWQKDYVSVLAQFEKKLDEAQGEIKSLEKSVAALKIPRSTDNGTSAVAVPAAPEAN